MHYKALVKQYAQTQGLTMIFMLPMHYPRQNMSSSIAKNTSSRGQTYVIYFTLADQSNYRHYVSCSIRIYYSSHIHSYTARRSLTHTLGTRLHIGLAVFYITYTPPFHRATYSYFSHIAHTRKSTPCTFCLNMLQAENIEIYFSYVYLVSCCVFVTKVCMCVDIAL